MAQAGLPAGAPIESRLLRRSSRRYEDESSAPTRPQVVAEGLYGDALIAHLENLQLLRRARRVKDHAIACPDFISARASGDLPLM